MLELNKTNPLVCLGLTIVLNSSLMVYSGQLGAIIPFVVEFSLFLFIISFISSNIIRNTIWILYFIVLGIQGASSFSTGQYLMPLALSNASEFAALGISSFVKTIVVFILYLLLSVFVTPKEIKYTKSIKNKIIWIVALIVFLFTSGPVHDFYKTVKLYYMQISFKPSDKIGESGKEFLKSTVYEKDVNEDLNFKDHNVIVIFTEGMSSEIIGKSNGRDFSITPNIDHYLSQGISFKNYYNHTAATFRGLRGQLTSGYQYRDGITNEGTGINQLSSTDINAIYLQRQVTMPQILRESGYKSYFIASTHKDSPLNTMLKTMDFDDVLGMGNFVGYQRDRMTDKQTFNALKYFLRSKKFERDHFFIGVYPSGTHHGQDSPNLKYSDGSNAYLNKFYNFDYQLGQFINYFKNSPFYNNTILIITADHSTFPSSDYKKTFNSDSLYFVNEIPFIIIGGSVKRQVINAHGRNSLSLAPTILNMLGIKYGMNYFLGCSLLDSECKSDFSNASAIGDDYFTTSDKANVTLIPSTDNSSVKQKIITFYNVSG